LNEDLLLKYKAQICEYVNHIPVFIVIYVFVEYLVNNAVSRADSIALKYRTVIKYCIGNDMEGSGIGLIYGIISLLEALRKVA
jgi:hypothetical protein